MKTIQVLELQKHLESDASADLIDVRTPAEFASVHVPGAKLCPLDKLDTREVLASRRGATGSPIYILCHSGARAKRAADIFTKAGCPDCVVVEGGTEAWAQAGLPVERGERQVLPLARQLQLVMGTLVLTGVLLGHFVNPAWIFLSGFVGAGLIFAGSTGICPMLSLIARMPWNQHAPAAKGASCCAN